MQDFIKSISLLFVILNPFLIIIYIIDIVKSKPTKIFNLILLRAGLISFATFSLFAILGNKIFNNFFNADFASFQIFGGIIFLLIGIQFVFKGSAAIEALRGESKYITGAIAMPIFIGPGTISYSVLIGQKLNSLQAILAIGIAVGLSIFILCVLKRIYDRIHTRKETLVEQYFDITGRITAMLVGTISIEMIMRGLQEWMQKII